MALRSRINYQKSLFDPIYGQWGVPAQFFVQGALPAIPLTVIDQTAGVSITDANTTVETIRPAAKVRAAELAQKGLSRDDMRAGTITFNGGCWSISVAQPKPSPNGESNGEYLLILSEA